MRRCAGTLAAELMASGAKLRPSAAVLDVQTERVGVRVQTRTGKLLAEAL